MKSKFLAIVAIAFTIAASAFSVLNPKPLATAWYELDDNTGALQQPLVRIDNPLDYCPTGTAKFCIREYNLDGSGHPTTPTSTPVKMKP